MTNGQLIEDYAHSVAASSRRVAISENGQGPDEIDRRTSQQPHYLGHRARLRQRFERSGFQGFAPHEVIELLLTLAIPRRDVKEQAKELLTRFGNLRAILDAPPSELREVPGLGEVAPIALQIIKEATTLYLLEKAEDRPFFLERGPLITFWRSRLGGLKYEVFEAAYLDASFKLLRQGIQRLQEGTIDRAIAYPRRVIEEALRRGAVAVVLAHNHPNGLMKPSERDLQLTRAIALAGAPLDVTLHDHLIVSAGDAFSFRDGGLL